ncbi:unnamed protein product [Rotaria socialis]|nr:unnamed protein product [Rotaria socialis]
MPFHQQQQQQNSYTNGLQFGYQQPKQNGYGYQRRPNFDFQRPTYNMPMNWQENNWLGSSVQELHKPLQTPPFYYPFDRSITTEGPNVRNQVRLPSTYELRDRSEYSRTPRRGILKQTGQRNTPMQRRLVHFMPEPWQQSKTRTNNTLDSRTMTKGKTGVQWNNRVPIRRRTRPNKTPERAHIDTIRRRERRERNRAFLSENTCEIGQLDDNRFKLLSETEGEETDNEFSETETETETTDIHNDKQQQQKINLSKKTKYHSDTLKDGVMNNNNNNNNNRQSRTTTDLHNNSEHVIGKNKIIKTRGNNQRITHGSKRVTTEEIIALSETEQDSDESLTSIDKKRSKTYLQGFKILAYLKDRMNNDRKVKLEFKDAFNAVCSYAKSTIEAYDKWVHNHYEVQVWQHFYDLGRQKDHWAKELINMTHTREAKPNMVLCEKKISQLTSECFDANNIIARSMREFSSDPSIPTATVIIKRAHDLMLDYIKESTQGLSKMSINRIRRASLEKDEWDALKTFENNASEQQKIYAKTFCKPAIKIYHKKKKNFDLIAAHISHDIIPKILPQYDFNLPLDEGSLSSELIQENRESIHKLSRDFRLKATELYLKIAKEEFEYQDERLEKLLEDFPQDRDQLLSTQAISDLDDDEPFDNEVFTQKPLSQRKENVVKGKGSDLFKLYIEIALKRALLETEREILFLDVRGVKETPDEISEARDLNPVLRKDFMLQA